MCTFNVYVKIVEHFISTGQAIIELVGNDTFSEGDGSVQCCVMISGLPSGGLGCNIEVMLDVTDGTDTNNAGVFNKVLCYTY